MANIENIITSTIYSFKERQFTMPDIFLVVGSYCTEHELTISLEEICNTVDRLGESGVIEHTTTPEGKGILRLSESALAVSMQNTESATHGR